MQTVLCAAVGTARHQQGLEACTVYDKSGIALQNYKAVPNLRTTLTSAMFETLSFDSPNFHCNRYNTICAPRFTESQIRLRGVEQSHIYLYSVINIPTPHFTCRTFQALFMAISGTATEHSALRP
jgi:hypothetical protein